MQVQQYSVLVTATLVLVQYAMCMQRVIRSRGYYQLCRHGDCPTFFLVHFWVKNLKLFPTLKVSEYVLGHSFQVTLNSPCECTMTYAAAGHHLPKRELEREITFPTLEAL